MRYNHIITFTAVIAETALKCTEQVLEMIRTACCFKVHFDLVMFDEKKKSLLGFLWSLCQFRSPRNCAEWSVPSWRRRAVLLCFTTGDTHTLFIIREELTPRCPIAVRCVTASQFIENKFIPGCYIQVKSTGSSISRSGSTPTHLKTRGKKRAISLRYVAFSWTLSASPLYWIIYETVGGFRVVKVFMFSDNKTLKCAVFKPFLFLQWTGSNLFIGRIRLIYIRIE